MKRKKIKENQKVAEQDKVKRQIGKDKQINMNSSSDFDTHLSLVLRLVTA